MRSLQVLLVVLSWAAMADAEVVRVGSKTFTESVILGELAAVALRNAGIEAEHIAQLGGTRVLTSALERGEVDVYPEYTGTIVVEILGQQPPMDEATLRTALVARGLSISRPLGFDNTYAIGMKEERAAELGIESISELVSHPQLSFGFTNEFMDRADGWPGLRRQYGLPQQNVRGLDHDLAYRGLAAGTIDATDLYSTDADIAYYRLRLLTDDRHYFPPYRAVWLMRSDLSERSPAAARALRSLEGRIDAAKMIAMNARAKLQHIPERTIATEFLSGASTGDSDAPSRLERVLDRTAEHLALVIISLSAAIAVAIPLGIAAALYPRIGQVILASVSVVQTIPSLALLVVLIPILGIGTAPALVALFLYGLLPIVRNTYTGLHDIPLPLRESAEALGLTRAARLRLVELPLASRAIVAGIKTSAVINVGTATLGALVGAGGYGQPILTGIRLDDVGLILEGALPAAAMALLAQFGFDAAERFLVPRGLRLSAETR